MSADTRATALLAATSWQPWTPGEPESAQLDRLLALAERFADWIEGDE